MIGAADSFEYSRIVMIKMEKLFSGIRIYRNPVMDSIIGAEFKNMAAGACQVRLLNSHGQVVVSKMISRGTGTSMEYIKPDYTLASGIYQLELTAPGKEVTIVKVIVK